jgi:hypothetical protein
VIRNWLTEFLPTRYGVTSGYIIPDLIGSSYKLYHYDIIIFDKINSPVLWTDKDFDTSELGRKRAIPAKYVYSVFEVKASFDDRSTKDAIQKLSELNHLDRFLPQNFTCGTIFFELKEKDIPRLSILNNLIPGNMPAHYLGGIVLRCDINQDMTGLISIYDSPSGFQSWSNLPLAKDIDKIIVTEDDSGNLQVLEDGEGLNVFRIGNQLHLNKVFGPMVTNGEVVAGLDWSYNEFARFTIILLESLEKGLIYDRNTRVFGQVFDRIIVSQKK